MGSLPRPAVVCLRPERVAAAQRRPAGWSDGGGEEGEAQTGVRPFRGFPVLSLQQSNIQWKYAESDFTT